MQSSSTFIRILGPIPEVKKVELINYYENITVYLEKSQQNEVSANKCALFWIYLSHTPGKFSCFDFYLSLETYS